MVSFNVLWGGDPQFDGYLHPWQVPIFAGHSRLAAIIDVLNRFEADIIGVEEAAGWDKGDPSTAEQVAKALDMKYWYIPQNSSLLKVALFSKYPISQREDLTTIIGGPGALHATIVLPDGSALDVVVAHLNATSQKIRSCQMRELLRLSTPLLQNQAVLIGDFNSVPGSDEVLAADSAGWDLIAADWPYYIDQIWASPSVGLAGSTWGLDIAVPSGVSDHDPVSAEVTFRQGVTAGTSGPILLLTGATDLCGSR